jgi:hypothetical protein
MDADEYDPARPNDYEEYVNERQARAQRRELERQQREQEREAQREQQRGFQQSVPMDEDDYREPSRGSSHHHRYSPPPQPSRRDSSPPPASAASAASGKLDLNVSGEEVSVSTLEPCCVRAFVVFIIAPCSRRPGDGEHS